MSIKLKKDGQLFKFLSKWGLDNDWQHDLCAVVQSLVFSPLILIFIGLLVSLVVLPLLTVILVAVFGNVQYLPDWIGAVGITEGVLYLLLGILLGVYHICEGIRPPEAVSAYIASRKEKYCARVEWK